MAKYKILAATLTGAGKNVFSEGAIVDGSQLKEAHIPDLLKGLFIEEVKEAEKLKTTKPTE